MERRRHLRVWVAGAAAGAVALLGMAQAAGANSAATAAARVQAPAAGGASWTIRSTPPGVQLSQVSCGGDGFCVAIPPSGNQVYVTTDLGATWTKQLPSSAVAADDAVSCGSAESCVVLGDDNGIDTFAEVTSNRGRSWTVTEDPLGELYAIVGLSCPNASHCAAAGYVPGELPSPLAAGWTSNGGRTWNSSNTDLGFGGEGVIGCATGTVCLMATGGPSTGASSPSPIQMYGSTDGGNSWTERGNTLTGLAYGNGVACPSARLCVVAGSDAGDYYDSPVAGDGAAWQTSDGGQAWKRASIPHSVTDLNGVACTNVADCWSVGTSAGAGGSQSGVILDSTNGGLTWNVEASDASAGWSSISCASGDCIAVGGSQIAQLVAPIAAIVGTPDGKGYDLTSADGGVFPYGDAGFEGDVSTALLDTAVVGSALTPDGRGYWLVTAGGGVYPFGDAKNYGSEAGKPLGAPIVGIAATADGRGYYLVGSDGGVFCFGDAHYRGSMGGKHLNKPIVAIGLDRPTGGYWIVAADGGVFSFGARYLGSAGSLRLAKPIVGMEPLAGGNGYRFVASDGGVFDFGAARFFGSLGGAHIASPVSGMASQPDGTGYWLVEANGFVTPFGSARTY